ncbi:MULTISPECIES: GNAT family N-acetyltransferase [unclassified Pseudonocardia]|uniref:GNAT family N-acetyltransferase n=1 Tax=unclassified Pseudonocardia TaxID=2619320 RepID=UPI0001FFEF16|nr:GNAT family N-acetyltransferase [Pseudonocardia sp. Ae707_Ps1]OLM17692.1 GCN5-related N-acetyltransferase [Pseudonocardia sp. Ae707_Ps1]
MQIRDATAEDADACAVIYAPYVRDTAVSFESEPPGPVEMAGRIAAAQERYVWLVAVTDDGDVLGYAYGAPFKPREAYRWTCEVSVYLHPEARGRGTGRALYEALLARLTACGLVVAVAVLTLPNEASVALHRALGFTEVGVFRGVGWKLGAWRDVVWYRRDLADPSPQGPAGA